MNEIEDLRVLTKSYKRDCDLLVSAIRLIREVTMRNKNMYLGASVDEEIKIRNICDETLKGLENV